MFIVILYLHTRTTVRNKVVKFAIYISANTTRYATPVLPGAIYAKGSEMRVDGNITFKNNSAGGQGGEQLAK